MGLFVKLAKPAAPMKKEAASAGVLDTPFGKFARHHRRPVRGQETCDAARRPRHLQKGRARGRQDTAGKAGLAKLAQILARHGPAGDLVGKRIGRVFTALPRLAVQAAELPVLRRADPAAKLLGR